MTTFSSAYPCTQEEGKDKIDKKKYIKPKKCIGAWHSTQFYC